MDEFKPGELFVYTRDGNCGHMELGQVKRKVDAETYVCWYSSGDTAARTNVRNMRKLANAGWSHVERFGNRARNIDSLVQDDLRGIAFAIVNSGADPCPKCAYRGSCEEGKEHWNARCEDGVLEWLKAEQGEETW